MKLLWLCNMVPGKVKEAVSGGSTGGGLWVDSVLEGLLGREDLNIRILCPGDGGEGKVNARCSYAFFSEGLPYVYLMELETQFRGGAGYLPAGRDPRLGDGVRPHPCHG